MKTQHTLRAMLATAALAALAAFPASGIITLEGQFTGATRYVSKSGSDSNGGTSWADAKRTIQAAVDLCADGDTVIVDDGEYSDTTEWTTIPTGSSTTYTNPCVVKITKRIHLVSRNGKLKTHIVGQWANTSTGVANNGTSHRCIYIDGPNKAVGTLIEGFTIRDGATAGSGTGNNAVDSGGGVCGGESNAAAVIAYLVDCDIVNCRAGLGAALSRQVVPIRCAFVGNRNVQTKANPHVFYRASYAYNCVFANNGNTAAGGANLQNVQGSRLVNCTFIDDKNGGVYANNTTNKPSMQHFATHNLYNCAFLGGGAMACATTDSNTMGVFLTNCVQTATIGRMTESVGISNCKTGVSALQHWFAADDGDWKFVVGGDLKDAGTDDALAVAATFVPEEYLNTDFFGNPRKVGDHIDIGAIEAQGEAANPALGTIQMGAGVAVRFGNAIAAMPGGRVSFGATTNQVRLVPTIGNSTPLFGYAVSGDWGSFYRYPDLGADRGAWITPPGATSNVVVSATVAADEKWVSASYAGGDSDGSAAKPYTTIQDAVTNTAAYGLVHVAPGTYATGGTTLLDHSVFARVGISGNIAIRSDKGPGATTIDGRRTDRCIAVRSRLNVVHIQGFTIKDGLTDVATTDNTAHHDAGAGFWVTPQSWTNTTGLPLNGYLRNSQVTDCVFVGNTARKGAAMCGGWAQRCVFTGNKIGDTLSDRGAVAHAAILSACLVTNNLQAQKSSICSVYHCLPYNVTFAEPGWCTDEATRYRPIDQNTPTYNCVFMGGYIDTKTPGGIIATGGDVGDDTIVSEATWLSRYSRRKLFVDPNAGDLHLRAATDAFTKGDASAYGADMFAVGDFEGNALAYVDGNPVPGAFSTLGPAEYPFVLTIR